MKLIWNELELGWECSECGALYGGEEVARIFNFDNQVPKNFVEGYHCIDCGGEFNEVIMEE